MDAKGEVHKILVEPTIRREDYGYLREYEIVRGEPVKLEIKFTNIGNIKFPGGKLIKPQLSLRTTVVLFREFEIPEIDVNKSVIVDFGYFVTIEKGSAWLKIQIRAHDGKDIWYYKNSRSEPSKTKWETVYYVVDRELLQIMLLLKELLEEIKNE